MKTINRILASAALLMGILAACTDLKDLDERVNTLESRITALEKVIPSLNGNVEALKGLLSAGTINSATQSGGVWTIVLNNGETLSLTQGSIGVGNAPVMSVDQDGYWMVNYGDGAQYIMNGDNKVLAIGTNGVTPLFGVDAEGYWTVSYDNGNTFSQVKGADDNPVSALPSGDVEDPYFDDVKLENNILTVTMKGGDTITIPVLSDFLCAIEAEGIQVFGYGETKPYNVSIKGVKSTMITAPTGWTASLSTPEDNKAVLSVTAPAAVKSTIADSGADVCILAFSEQNLATIAKIQVQLADAPAVVTPVANVTAGEATESTLTYNVATVNTTSWKYMLLKDSEPAPDAAKIATDGTEGTGTSLILQDLDPSTTYVLYVLPVNGEVQGAVTSAENTTKKQLVASYYALYQADETITIDGVTISKATHGDATLMEADGNITTNGVYFLKEGVTATYTGTGAIKSLAVIGDKEGSRSVFKAGKDSKNIKLNPGTEADGTGLLLFSNVVFDHSEGTQYAINVNFAGTFGSVLFNNCQIKQCANKALIYNFDNNNKDKRAINNLAFTDCDIEITSTQAFVGASTSTTTNDSYKVSNCIFYGDGSKAFALHGGNAVTYNKIIFTNNTFVNVSASNNVFFNCGTVKTATIMNNIFYMSAAMSANMNIVKSTNTNIESGSILDNICHTDQENTFMAIYGGSDKWFSGVEEITKLDSDPFAGGTFNIAEGKFTPSAEYASYGAQR